MTASRVEPDWALGDATNSEWCMQQILHNEGVEDEEILANTPHRWVEAFRAMQGGDGVPFQFTTFASGDDGMVIVGPIDFASLCAHHLLPFFGVAHFGYIPNGRMVGLSKIPRLIQSTALGLWSQEDLTEEIARTFERNLTYVIEVGPNAVQDIRKPKGVAVVLKAEHTCMSVRGPRTPGAKSTTSSMLGVFRDNQNNARVEFLTLIK